MSVRSLILKSRSYPGKSHAIIRVLFAQWRHYSIARKSFLDITLHCLHQLVVRHFFPAGGLHTIHSSLWRFPSANLLGFTQSKCLSTVRISIAMKSFLNMMSAILNEKIQWVLKYIWRIGNFTIPIHGEESLHSFPIDWLPACCSVIGWMIILELLSISVGLNDKDI